jgi:hypothetical protein
MLGQVRLAAARLGGQQHQHLVDQVAEALERTDALAGPAVAFGGIGFLGQQLELGADAGQGGAQLVGGVGDEALLGVGSLLQAVQQQVEFG